MQIRLLQLIRTYALEIVSFVAGAIVLAFELSASRVVAPYMGSTIYIWTSIIGGVLAGLAIGYTFGGYIADQHHRKSDVMRLLVVGAVLILIVDIVKDPLLGYISSQGLPLRVQAFIASIILFIPPTMVLGTIPPYLARLSLTSLATSGKHIARINAAGTLGSLAGTFLTGYVLFGFVGTRSILAILALCAVLISFVLVRRGWLVPRLIVIALSVLLIIVPPALQVTGVAIYRDVDSLYGRYIIGNAHFNGRQVRVLQPDIFNWKSGVYSNGDTKLVFPYTQEFGDIISLLPSDHRMLMIGGGTFTVPAFAASLSPANKIDVVEIDGRLQALSKQYFNFEQSSNLHIIQADGRQFLNDNTSRYDLVFLDAFSAQVPPFQLVTEQAAQRVRDSLKPDGMVVMNVVASLKGPGAAFTASMLKTYGQAFPYVDAYPVQVGLNPATDQNILLLASVKPLPIMEFKKDTADKNFSLSLAHVVRLTTGQGIILSDDYAPVERLLANY